MKVNNMWKDNTTYSESDNKRIPSIWTYKFSWITITVHRHIDYPKDKWLLTCIPFYDLYELKDKDVNKAKFNALNMVYDKIKKLKKEMKKVIKK